MPRQPRIHDRILLDALEAIGDAPFQGDVWRVASKGRDALAGSTGQGRWSPPGEFEVLYTSLDRNGALTEVGHRLSLEPIWPSRIEHEIHLLEAGLDRSLRFASVDRLGGFGVDVARYQSFDYEATQAIAAAAHFLEYDGLIVPSARYACLNMVAFMDRVALGVGLVPRHSEPVDWAAWRLERKRLT